MFVIEYGQDWDQHLPGFEIKIQERIAKKIAQLVFLTRVRHLKHGLPYFVVEVNQYRICFTQNEKIRKIIFVGNHKQYEAWYLSLG